MTSESLAHHGGDLASAARRFPAAPAPWIDLSTGINPHAYPIPTLDADVWRRLPDASATAKLERAAALNYRCGLEGAVVGAPGTQALIQILPRLIPARSVAILGFGYQEHPTAWRRAGATVTIVESLDGLRAADVAIVVNPNNPDGRQVDRDDLLALATDCAMRGTTLVVDEAFMDVMPPAESLVPVLPESGAIVLRSFGKVFGLGGLRLGFAITGAAFAARLRDALGPWAVSGPAVAIGTHALQDTEWLAGTVRHLGAQAARLDRLLSAAAFSVLGGTPLFRLASHAAAGACFERLGRAGILVRPFATHPTWLRFGIPPGEPSWDRLEEALRP